MKVGTIGLLVVLLVVSGCASLPKPTEPTYGICGNCGKEIPLNVRKCPFCGAVLSEPKRQPDSRIVEPEEDVLYTLIQGKRPKRVTLPETPKVKVGGLMCVAERDAQRFFDAFVSVELIRILFYPEDPFSPGLVIDIGVAHELFFLGVGLTHLVEGWEDFGAFLFVGIDWKRRYDIDEADGAFGFGLSFGGF